MTVRLKDIANELGLSVVTISKVLRDHPDIGAETRKRVLKRMRELNYQPNLAARSLVTGRIWTLGLVVPDLLHPFFAEVAKAISSETRKQGYSLFISSSDEDPNLEVREIKQMLARRVDVIIVASAQRSVECFRLIEEQKTPYILIDRRFPGLDANFVGVDDEAVGLLATSHLIEQGCRRGGSHPRPRSEHGDRTTRRLQAGARAESSDPVAEPYCFTGHIGRPSRREGGDTRPPNVCLAWSRCRTGYFALTILPRWERCGRF